MNPEIYLTIALYVGPMVLTLLLLFIMNKYKIDAPTSLGQALVMSCLPFLNVGILMILLAIVVSHYLAFYAIWKRLNTWVLQGRDIK